MPTNTPENPPRRSTLNMLAMRFSALPLLGALGLLREFAPKPRVTTLDVEVSCPAVLVEES